MRRAILSLHLLVLAGCPPTTDDVTPVFFEPGNPVDLGRRPLARISSPVIVSRGDDVTLTGTAWFFAVFNACNVNGCGPPTVREEPEPFCVALRGTPRCEHAVAPHTLDEVPAGAAMFFGRFERGLTASPGFTTADLTVTGATATGPVDEGHLGLPGANGRDETLELVVVGEGDDATVDVAPEGVPVEQTLGGFDTDDGAGLLLIRRDGQLVAIDGEATATTGGLVGATIGDVYLDDNGGRNVAGAPVAGDVVVVRMTATDRFDPLDLPTPSQPQRLFFEALPGSSSSSPLRPFRLVRASTPTPASVRLCFNRRLDAASLADLRVEIQEAPAVGPPTLLPGGQCVSVHTQVQAPLSGLTITASGGLRSVAGEVLEVSTAGLQTPPLRVESVTRLFPGIEIAQGFEPSLEPAHDGSVLVNGGGLLDPALLHLGASALPEGAIRLGVVGTLLPDRTGFWVTVPDGLALVDGDDVTRFVTPPARVLHPLEGGVIVIGTDAGASRLDADGTVTALPVPTGLTRPELQTPVIDGDGAVFWIDTETLEQVLLDGDGTELARFTADNARFVWAVSSGGSLFAIDGSSGRLVTFDPATATVTPVLETADFGGWSRLDDGGVEFYLVRTTLRSPVLRLRDGVLTALAIPDPTGGFDTSSLGRARIVGEQAFVYGFRHSAIFLSHAQLRVMHKDTWAALQEGAEEAP